MKTKMEAAKRKILRTQVKKKVRKTTSRKNLRLLPRLQKCILLQRNSVGIGETSEEDNSQFLNCQKMSVKQTCFRGENVW